MPKLSVCPFSVAVFFGTAALVAYHKRKQQQQQQQASEADDEADMPVCQVVFVLGAPGVGKGTQCQLLAERLGTTKKGNNSSSSSKKWVHLSAGDLLRAERRSGSALAREINDCIAHGRLVRSEITCQLLENAMRRAHKSDDGTTHFLVDGYPRSRENVDAWQKTMRHHVVRFVLDYECPEETLIGRLLERGKQSGRTDDNLETVRKRFATFQKETAPILDYYRTSTSVPVHTIATDKSVEEVYRETEQYFEYDSN